MKICREKYLLCFVIIALFFHFATAQTQTTVSEASFTYDGTEFGFFQTSPVINQSDAQTECMNWGGNLATIKSDVEDSLLLYSSPDLNTIFTCHIGLNKTGGIEFVWINGSTSSYRNWGMNFPIGDANRDCVRNRYLVSAGNLSQGWLNDPCDTKRNCYFCSKSGTSNGCDLIYDGSCYKVFEVSTPIKWLEAQSSCAIWGGDLTSITTERENNYLNTLITSSVGNSWIGLNDRDVEGTYTWIDGTAVSYTNWTGTQPNVANSDCVRINNAGNGIWESVSCNMTLNAILCKRDSSITSIPTGARFGRITNGGLKFEALTGNTFFYEPLTLICKSNASSVAWRYSQNSDLSGASMSVLTETSNYVDFSWLEVDNTMQGYYRCTMSNAMSYTVGVYDKTLTTVAVTETSYTYIVGVDRTDVLLLCVQEDGGNLSTLRWILQNGMEFFNPINLNSESSNLPNVSTFFSCKRGGLTLNTTQICVKVPTISISYGVVPVTSYSSVYPAMNTLFVPSVVQDITLSINIDGKWTLPDSTESANSVLTIPNFSLQENGVYKFYTNNWDGVKVCAIQVTLTTTTTITGEILLSNTPTLLNYTAGSVQILYYTNDTIKGTINWTLNDVKDGDTEPYSKEFPNPVEMSTIFSAIGNGVHTLTVFYRMSPVTHIGSVELAIKDTVEVTISYGNFTHTTSDVSNQLFPSPQEIVIPTGTRNIIFSCNMPNCKWEFEAQPGVFVEPYNINILAEDNEGIYSLVRNTSTGEEYLTARVYINVRPSEASSSITLIGIAIIPIIIIICLIVVMISIIICVWKRRTPSPFAKQKLKNGTPTKVTKQEYIVKEYTNKPDTLEHNNQTYLELNDIVETDFTDTNSSPKRKLKQRDSEIAYEMITEVIDPRMAPIPLDVFKIHMNKIWKNEGALLEEYESLGGKSHRYPCTYGTIEENKVKNRFKLIYPYDKSRVTLIPKDNSTNSDYINACTIPGYYTKECFIAAQGPKENTIQDFWQMILENNIVNIVMVTNLVESGRRKCEAYFSLKIGERVAFGPYEINLDKEEVKTGYTIRKISVHHMGKTTHVKHFHFTAWPDHDVPTLYDELLLFVSKVKGSHIKTNAPILVHCSAGVGRTGTFITLYNLLTAIQQIKPINIYSTVHAMREHRPQMVQAFAQYKFIYLSVLEILLGNTSIQTHEFFETFNSYMKSEDTGYVSIFFEQFSELNYQCEKAFDPVCTTALEECNSKKNPIDDILPNDTNRVILYSQKCDGDYINASNIEGGEIILTIHPTAETLENFYQLLYQVGPSLVVMLCSKKELQLIQQNKSQRVTYWPNMGESLQTDSFTITCEINKKLHFIRNRLNIQHLEEQSNIVFTQIITDQWNEKGEPNLKYNVFLLQAMVEFHTQYPGKPIIIHCNDGAGKSGVLYTVFKAIKDSKDKGSIDIFHIVKKLRNERMNSVATLNHFLACYTLMNEYLF